MACNEPWSEGGVQLWCPLLSLISASFSPYNHNAGTFGMGIVGIPYVDNVAANYLLVASNGTVQLDIPYFNLGSACCDSVSVYDGPSSSAPLLGTMAGQGLTGSFTSNGSYLFVAVTTDSSATFSGFLATFVSKLFCPYVCVDLVAVAPGWARWLGWRVRAVRVCASVRRRSEWKGGGGECV